MDNGKELLRKDLLRMARRWRKVREPYIDRGGENAAELAEFEDELDRYFFPGIMKLAATKQITNEEACKWCAEIHGEWANLVIWSRGTWFHKLKRWMIHG